MGGVSSEETITVIFIMDCLTITVHAGKCYKALIDSKAAISLIQYSTYQHIDNSFKTPIQPTTEKLNTGNSLPMTTLGITALHLKIEDFNSHTILLFVIDCQTLKLFWNRCSEEILYFLHMEQREKFLHTQRWEMSNIYTKL